MKRLLLTTLTAAALLGACASHQHFNSMDEVYVKYDLNKDGVITKQEFVSQWRDKEKAENAWKKIDVKNNGFVQRGLDDEAPLNVWQSVESNSDPW